MHGLVCLLSYKPGSCREPHLVPPLIASPRQQASGASLTYTSGLVSPCDTLKGRWLSKHAMEVGSLSLPLVSL